MAHIFPIIFKYIHDSFTYYVISYDLKIFVSNFHYEIFQNIRKKGNTTYNFYNTSYYL